MYKNIWAVHVKNSYYVCNKAEIFCIYMYISLYLHIVAGYVCDGD